jgi:7-cyano-7-deazaguanine synthase in queuosine biosynthesis
MVLRKALLYFGTFTFNRRKVNYKLAIPFSGGWDSACAVTLLDVSKPFIFTVDYGHPYSNKELEAVKMISKRFNFKYKKFKIDLLRKDLGNMISPENYTIPSRNLFLAWLGSNFADRVIIGSSLSDNPTTPDKSLRFYQLASATLSYGNDRDVTVYTPFVDKTKMDMFNMVVDAHGKKEAEWLLLNSVSCHSPTTRHCGECLPCIKKWFVMKEAGLPTELHFINDPMKSKIGLKMVAKLSMK